MVETFLKAKRFHQQTQPLSVGFRSSQGQWHENVLFGGEHRQQVEALEDESDVAAAQQRKLVVVHARQIVAIEYDVPAGCTIQSCHACINVDLPEPEGPIIAVNFPFSKAR